MKLMLWQFEWDFDKDDAKIAVPILLLALGLVFTPLDKTWLLVGAVIYYLLYFFLKQGYEVLRKWLVVIRLWMARKCPYCKSRNVFLKGYQGPTSSTLITLVTIVKGRAFSWISGLLKAR